MATSSVLLPQLTAGSTLTDPATGTQVKVTTRTDTALTVEVTIPPNLDVTPPTIEILAPAEEATVSSPVTVRANIDDANGITTSKFYFDCSGSVSACVYTYVGWPYTLQKNLDKGRHSVRIQAWDPAGNVTLTASRFFTVGDKTPPDIKTSWQPAQKVSGIVTLSAEVSDDSAIREVTFSSKGKIIGRATAAPYRINWNTTNLRDGEYPVIVTAIDVAENVSEATSIVIIDNPLKIKIVKPTGKTRLKGRIPITVTFTSGTGKQRIKVYRSGRNSSSSRRYSIGQDTKAPYSVAWDTRAVRNGAYRLTVVGSDSTGQKATKTVTVKVAN